MNVVIFEVSTGEGASGEGGLFYVDDTLYIGL